MFNVGFKKAMEDDPSWDCIILHDVDMVPMSLTNLYKCGESVSHLKRFTIMHLLMQMYSFCFHILYPISYLNSNQFKRLLELEPI